MTGFKYIFPFALAALFACSNPAPENEKAQQQTARTEEVPEGYKLSYRGLLPCDSCEGALTTLRISTDYSHFLMEQKHLKEHGVNHSSKGALNTERGYGSDADATVYILNDDKPADQQLYFLRETGRDGVLVKLNGARQKMRDEELKQIND